MENLRTSGASLGHKSKEKEATRQLQETKKLAAIDILLNKTDILCLQEHWLHRFEENRLNRIAEDYKKGYTLKCFDDNDPLPPTQRSSLSHSPATLLIVQ